MINQSLPTSSLQAFQMSNNKFQITDEDLILRFQSGDENAYSEIVSRYRDRLVNFIFRFMNDFDQEVNHLDIETGDILLFPSWLDHGVKANMTDKHRVNISFNFGVPELVNALG